MKVALEDEIKGINAIIKGLRITNVSLPTCGREMNGPQDFETGEEHSPGARIYFSKEPIFSLTNELLYLFYSKKV